MTNAADPRSTVKVPAPAKAGRGCRAGGDCDGAEWVYVGPAYAERLFPLPPAPTLETAEHAAVWAAVCDGIERKRRAAANSAYPCRACNPRAFYRWAGRHLDADHDRGSCAECKLIAEEARRRPRRDREPTLLPTAAEPTPGPGF